MSASDRSKRRRCASCATRAEGKPSKTTGRTSSQVARASLAALALFAAAAPRAAVADDGPCTAADALPAIVDRPGTGRPTATSGSPCVVPNGAGVVEIGLRSQETLGPLTSNLFVAPMVALRAGVAHRLEAILLPPAFSRRTGSPLLFPSAAGAQDLGAGVKLQLRNRPFVQDALSLLYTAPTGSGGPAGFSAGGSTYTLAYAAGVSIGVVGVTTTQQVVLTATPGARFTAYAPSITVGIPLAGSLTFLLSDTIATRTGPASGAGNRAFAALQSPIGRRIIIDAEYEVNALPAPGLHQHAIGVGAAFLAR